MKFSTGSPFRVFSAWAATFFFVCAGARLLEPDLAFWSVAYALAGIWSAAAAAGKELPGDAVFLPSLGFLLGGLLWSTQTRFDLPLREQSACVDGACLVLAGLWGLFLARRKRPPAGD